MNRCRYNYSCGRWLSVAMHISNAWPLEQAGFPRGLTAGVKLICRDQLRILRPSPVLWVLRTISHIKCHQVHSQEWAVGQNPDSKKSMCLFHSPFTDVKSFSNCHCESKIYITRKLQRLSTEGCLLSRKTKCLQLDMQTSAVFGLFVYSPEINIIIS